MAHVIPDPWKSTLRDKMTEAGQDPAVDKVLFVMVEKNVDGRRRHFTRVVDVKGDLIHEFDGLPPQAPNRAQRREKAREAARTTRQAAHTSQ